MQTFFFWAQNNHQAQVGVLTFVVCCRVAHGGLEHDVKGSHGKSPRGWFMYQCSPLDASWVLGHGASGANELTGLAVDAQTSR